jgi:hypothetical protein
VAAQIHTGHLRSVLQLLRTNKLYAKRKKCQLVKERVGFLGHTVSSQGIEVDGNKVEAITRFPPPQSPRELLGFLGAANFFRRFVRHFAHMALPLNSLLKKDRPWVWGEAQQAAFDAIKHALTTAPVLKAADNSLPWIVYTDASDLAIGAVAMQDHGDGPQPVAYLSKQHTPAQRNYPTREKELLSIVTALREWRYYFADSEVTVYTDHDSLRYLQTQTLPLVGRMARWLETTQDYNLKIGYVPGNANKVADALSRVQLSPLVRAELSNEDCATIARIGLSYCCAPAQCASVAVAAVGADLLAAIKACYRSDPVAKAARRALASGEDCSFSLQQGLLYFQGGEEPAHGRLYIPTRRQLRQRLIAEHHDAGPAGHLGRDKTTERLSRLFYWPQLGEHVREYVLTCPSCQMTKPRVGKKPGLLQPLPIPSHAWESTSMDFINSLPRTASGHDAILTCVCTLTKMVRFIPTSSEVTAEGTADLVYRHIWSLFGTPRRIISDRDPRFTSGFWQTLMRLVRTQLNTSTSFHPETDGQTERMHRLVEEILRHYVGQE